MAKFLADASLFIERHNKHFKPDEDDDVWMPAVAANGWSVITADKRKTARLPGDPGASGKMRDKGEPSSPPKPITIDDALAAKYSGPDQFERSMRRLDP